MKRSMFNHIKSVSFFNTLGLIPNGLAVNLHNGITEKFVVGKRSVWKEKIEMLKGGINASDPTQPIVQPLSVVLVRRTQYEPLLR